jgi:nitrogenase molybdenum-iron protein alpha/beta subunit
MPLNNSPIHTSRAGGCTLTGALSVTTRVSDAVSVIHGPKGCTHHNFSLLHATALDNDLIGVPDLVSSALDEGDIIFGGEETLARTIRAAGERDVSAVFVLSACVVETIGDDVVAVCSQEYRVPVIPIPTAGFLGGTFQDGVNKALIALAGQAQPAPRGTAVSIIGEKNLEYEVEENYAEVVRLLALLGLEPGIRFVHDLPFSRITELGSARLNILRDPSLVPVGEYLRERFGTPYIPSFPTGLSDTLTFISNVASACDTDAQRALDIERSLQAEILASFADLCGKRGFFTGPVIDHETAGAAQEVADALRIRVEDTGTAPALPVHPVVGTSGIRRLLHRWRRSLHA